MRIISGSYKNRKINFTGLKVRPTTDFAKESLFNLLNNYYDFNSTTILDLFAGTGNISYEFASRGSTDITSVDHNKASILFINKIKEKLAINVLQTVRMPVVKFLKKNTRQYDIIFADPPFSWHQEQYNCIVDLILNNQILENRGSLVIEHSKFIKFEKNSN